MIRTRTAVHLGAALTISAVVGLATMQWMKTRPAAETVMVPAKPAQTTTVAVASTDLFRGVKLSADSFRLKQVPIAETPAGGLADAKAIEGRLVAAPIAADQPITEDKLVKGDIGDILPPGKRAFSVKAAKVHGLGGTIKPGAIVDVLVTMDDFKDQEKKITKLVLSSVPVLASEEEPAPEHKPDKRTDSLSTMIYTLELTTEEAEKLAMATTHGVIHFALRNRADDGVIFTRGADYDAMLASYRTYAPPARKPSAPKPRVVEVIKGEEIEKKSF